MHVNLHPFRHMDAAKGWALSPLWLETLDWAVKGALAARLGKLTPESWNEYLREGLAAVRATNPTRVVILGGGSWNSIDDLQKLVLALVP